MTILDDDSPGSLVPGFDAGLIVDGSTGAAYSAVEQPDGKILIGGVFESFRGIAQRSLVRLNADGTVDTSFNANLPEGANVRQLLLQRDGRILAIGANLRPGAQALQDMTRFHLDGTLDSTFNRPSALDISLMALQPDGKILLAGSFMPFGGTQNRGLVRINANGSADPTLNFAGYSNSINALVVQPNARILVGTDSGLLRIYPGGEADPEFVLDPALNGNFVNVAGLALQPDGKIIAGGTFYFLNQSGPRPFVRFNPDGSLDSSFDVGVASGPNTSGYSVALQGDGRIVVKAYVPDSHGLKRLNADGTPDTTFEVTGLPTSGLVLLLHNGDLLVSTTYPNRIVRLIGGRVDSAAPAQLGFTWNQLSVSEAAGEVVVTVRREGSINGTVSVNYATGSGTASAGSHYTATSGTLEFAQNETVKTLVVPVFNTSAIDGTRSFQIALSAPVGASLVTSATAEIAILDDERPGRLQLDAVSYVIREGTSGVFVKVQRTFGADGEVSVRLVSTSGTANSATDFAALSQVLTFAPGVFEMSASLVPRADSAVEGDESFSIQLAEITGGATLDRRTNATVTIQDVNDPGSLIADYDLALSSARIFATVLQPDGRTVIAGQFTADGGRYNNVARLNSDGTLDTTFVAGGVPGIVNAMVRQADGKLIIAGNFTAGEARVRNVARLSADGTLDLSFVAAATDKPVSTVGVQSDGHVIIGGAFTTVGGATRAGLARLEANGVFDATFQPSVSGGVFDLLVTPQDQILYIGASNSVIRLNADGTGDFWFRTTIDVPFNTSRLTSLVLDSEGRLLVGGSFNKVNGVARINIARLLPDGRIDPSFDAGTAFSGHLPELLTLQPDGRILGAGFIQSGTRGPVVRLSPDGPIDSTFRVSSHASTAAGHFTAMTILPGRGLLVAGDFKAIDGVARPGVALLLLGPLPGAFRIAGTRALTVGEGESLTVEVERVGGSAGRATVRYETEAGSAEASTDFVAANGTLVFEDGVTTGSFSVSVVDDAIYERLERFSVRLFEPAAAFLPAISSTGTVDVADNDPVRLGTPQFAPSSLSVNEDQGVATLLIERVDGSDETIWVTYATSAGSAHADSDFRSTSGTLQFGHRVTTASIQVPLVNNWLAEGVESFTVALSGACVTGPTVATVTIQDGDTQTLDSMRGTFSGRAIHINSAGAAGFAKLKLGPGRIVSGTITIGRQRLSFRGEANEDGYLSTSIARRGTTPALLGLHLDVQGESERFNGVLQVDGLTWDISAALHSFDTKNPSAAAGRYNVVFEHDQADAPPGSGYAQLVVGKNGSVRASGALANGTRWSHGGMLSRDGHSPFLVSLYGRTGLLHGDFVFTQSPTRDCAGSAHWSKPANEQDLLYSLGFSVALGLNGSSYSKVANTPALGFTQGRAHLTDSSMLLPSGIDFSLSAANRFLITQTTEGLSLTVNASTGLVGGEFVHPSTGRAVKIQGVVLLDENRAAGFFSAPGVLGGVDLLPR